MNTPSPIAAGSPADVSHADFSHVDTWVFDLDNTLYPPGLDLWRQIDMKMRAYIANFLGLSLDEAFALQKGYYRKYGTSLRGLMIEHAMDPDDFLAHVHAIDLASLEAAPALGEAIGALPGRKLVYTNGSRRHAEQVLAKLGISEHFADVHDIVAAEFHPKPQEAAYRGFLTRFEVDPARAAMFEDLARNLEVPARLGMRTVLVVPPGLAVNPADREAWEHEGRDGAHIDVVTQDLTAFLNSLRA
ncbi:pyrimidine 5'-nucleotidase [Ancylobacter dichloromethanicus]|uniref:Pyrimidine 5'-nucleotidase n=1 Tax=Ancylobacter dichloromethanicus TaxID=518825 RepID=A0A9W6MZD2_9HYPH|nr:pyrimidine 5'-nucleotidase [Ancylobacter dichloromethanicus]MBS7552619.1 pyrimidine 5'-nucleotidase [Ancylobacter dichloromethanicus]GLK71981.1 pyrimidine 5'-nucleotidase [Ancylobacter dichloromethanicus]